MAKSLLRRALELRGALTASSFWGYDISSIEPTHAGVSVNQETATRMSAVFGAQALLTDDISTLPLKAYTTWGGGKREITPSPTWMRMPSLRDPNMTLVEHLAQVVLSILSDGNAFVRGFPSIYMPNELWVLNPERVDVRYDSDQRPSYTLRGISLTSLGPEDILHIPYMRKAGRPRGLSPVEALSEAIGGGIAAEQFSSNFYSNGANMQGVIEVPRETQMTTEQVQQMLRSFKRSHSGIKNAHAIGALTNGATMNWMTVKPSDALVIDAQKWSVEQIARAYKIPPHMLGSQEGRANAYASVEQKSQDYVTHAVAPLCTRIESAYSRLLPSGSFVEFNLQGLLRAAAADRAQYYAAMIQTGSITPNIIAEKENYPTFDGGDHHYLPVNNLAPIDEPADVEAGEAPDTEPAGAAA